MLYNTSSSGFWCRLLFCIWIKKHWQKKPKRVLYQIESQPERGWFRWLSKVEKGRAVSGTSYRSNQNMNKYSGGGSKGTSSSRRPQWRSPLLREQSFACSKATTLSGFRAREQAWWINTHTQLISPWRPPSWGESSRDVGRGIKTSAPILNLVY